MSPDTKTDGPAGDFVFGDAIIPSGVPGGQAIRAASIRTLVDYIPYIAWCMISVLYALASNRFMGASYSVSFRAILSNFITPTYVHAYWFFPAIFGIYLSIPAFACLKPREKCFDYLILCALLFNSLAPLLSSMAGIAWNYDFVPSAALGYAVYPLLGWRLTHIELTARQRHGLYLAGVLAWLVQFSGTALLSNPETGISTVFKGYQNLPAVIQAAAVLIFVKQIHWGKRVSRIAAELSKYTFGVYLLHCYPVFILPAIAGFSDALVSWKIVGAFAIFASCCVITAIMQHIPIIRRIVP
jgi:surface polysaccharide O-acyltransferase-like enzyme